MAEVYRVYDEVGRLLYIGCADRLRRRFYHHDNALPYWLSYATVLKRRHYQDLDYAKRVEARAIRLLRPEFNVYHQRDQTQRIRATRGLYPSSHRIPLCKAIRKQHVQVLINQIVRENFEMKMQNKEGQD